MCVDASLVPPHCPHHGWHWDLVTFGGICATGCHHDWVGVTMGGSPHMWGSPRAGATLTLCPRQMAAGRMAVVFPGHRQSWPQLPAAGWHPPVRGHCGWHLAPGWSPLAPLSTSVSSSSSSFSSSSSSSFSSSLGAAPGPRPAPAGMVVAEPEDEPPISK